MEILQSEVQTLVDMLVAEFVNVLAHTDLPTV